jgi:plasmid stabilization system protein ParE
MRIKILPPAESRLLAIWRYTCKRWDEEQADSYIAGLVAAVEEAADRPESWKSVRDPALRGVWFIRFRHHFIFFRQLPSGCLGVISILHESMDIPRRLEEDTNEKQ